jgi:hypothetical protein
MTRRDPPVDPPEAEYVTAVRLGNPVRCCVCDVWLTQGSIVHMTRFGFEHPAGCQTEMGQ